MSTLRAFLVADDAFRADPKRERRWGRVTCGPGRRVLSRAP